MKTLNLDAINPFTGRPFTMDDPNLRWGDPSYYLEPGDPGFVPYASTVIPTKPRKKHTMSKQPFMPRSEAARQAWLKNFVLKLMDASKGYATKYNIPAATVTALDNGRQWVDATMDTLPGVRSSAQSFTAFKDGLFTGSGALTVPVLPVFTPPGVPLAAGVFTLAGAIGSQIKLAPNYSVADGEDLGLEGAAEPSTPAGSVAPDLAKSRITSGGHPEIVWKKGRYTGLKIMVDRGDGKGEVFLAIDTQPNYIDTVLPAAGTTATYTYRAIYLMGDEEFGQWSQPFQITVRG
jgi:hypothetical protein